MMPSVVGKFTQIGAEVLVESGAGDSAYASDAEYSAAGARIIPGNDLNIGLEAADVVVTIPMAHGVDSLNVAAASAVALYALQT